MSSGSGAAVAAAIGAGTAGVLTFVGGVLDRRGQRRASRLERTDEARRAIVEEVAGWAADCERMAYRISLTGDPRAESYDLERRSNALVSSGKLRIYAPALADPVVSLARKWGVLHSELKTLEADARRDGEPEPEKVWQPGTSDGMEERRKAVTDAAHRVLEFAIQALATD